MDRERTGRSVDEDRRVTLPDGEIRVRIRGRGPPVLCLHGLSSHGAVWERPALRLSERFTVYLPDLLGRGASDPRPDVSYGLDEELGRVRALLEELQVDPAVTVGHSQGAAIALARAAATGGRRGFVLVCPVTPRTRRPAVLGLLQEAGVRRTAAPLLARARRPLARWVLQRRVYGDPSRADPAAVTRYTAPYADPRRAEALLRALADWRPAELEGRLPRAVPAARVLAGGRDRHIPPREARWLAGRIGASFEIVPEAGHLLPEEAPWTVARAVEAVYAEVDGAERG